jgi:hypothetical protein
VGPIETLFVTIQLLIAMIGVVRGYARELGNTLVFMAAIFFLSYVGGLGNPRIVSFAENTFGFAAGSEQLNAFLFFLYVGVFLAIVFASYAGKTLDFGGKPLRAPEGTILSVLVGLLNGYLVAGTIWYYANLYNYPYMNVDTSQLTSTAQFMIAYLPQAIATNPVAWMVPVALLILLRVRG